MGLKEDIQRNRAMEAKGHYHNELETRDIRSDRAIVAKVNKAKSVTKEPIVITNLLQLFK